MQFILTRGPRVVQFLSGSGMRGVKALQRATLNSYEIITEAQALKSANWASHRQMVQSLNKALHGQITNISGTGYHHIVEQGGANALRFSVNALNSLANVVPVSTNVHKAISGFYSSGPMWVRNLGYTRVRDWMYTQPWETQYRYGKEILQQALQRGGGQINWMP
jgi:hypothetical protein